MDLDKEKAAIEDTRNWPYYPVLPVKRWRSTTKTLDFGVIIAPTLTTVYDVMIFDLRSIDDMSQYGKYEYEDLDALLADGWYGD